MNRIEFSSIFSDGYGVIPKKLMTMEIPDYEYMKGKKKPRTMKIKGNYVKLILAYMLSYTGAGKNECFPSVEKISKDLEISREYVVNAIKSAENIGLLTKEKMYPNDPLKHNNKYILNFMNNPNFIIRQGLPTHDNVYNSVVDSVEQNINIINNNNINNNISELVNTYPVKCPIKKTFTKRSVYNKDKLKKIIQSKGLEECKKIINLYVDDCKKTNVFLKNFKTFVNNFPSLDDFSSKDENSPPDSPFAGMTQEQLKEIARKSREDAERKFQNITEVNIEKA